MTSPLPNFSPYPFERLRRVSSRGAAIESAIARWIAARPLGARVARLAGGPVLVTVLGVRDPAAPDKTAQTGVDTVVGVPRHPSERKLQERRAAPGGRVVEHTGTGAVAIDPHAALAEVRIGGLAFVLAASARPIRLLAQRLLGGPAELDAPRPLTTAEQAIWALAIAAAIEDTGVAAEVWPLVDAAPRDAFAIDLVADVAGTAMTISALCPPELTVRAAPARPLPAWSFDVRVVVAECSLPRESLTRLAVRDVVTVERRLALSLGSGTIALSAAPGAVEAEVVTGYVSRDMAPPDDVHLELTVELGTTSLSVRQLTQLAPGQIVPLGRPLSGPFEVRAAGRLVGTGELVDVDGELAVRILSLQE